MIVLVKVHYYCTDGFRVNKILNISSIAPNWPEHPFDKKNDKILRQKFYYLGKGRQTYVFCSADDRYVIKFIRYHKYVRPLWSLYGEKYSMLTARHRQALHELQERKERAFLSYQLASKDLKEKTRIVALHLDPYTKIDKKVSIVDRIGRSFTIDLNYVGFIIQKKARPFFAVFKKSYEQKQEDKIHHLLDAIIESAAYRISKGICNRDFANSVRNSGVYKQSFIEMDVGSFYLEEKEECAQRLGVFLEPFRHFFTKNAPEYLPYFDRQVQRTLGTYAQNP